MSVLKPYMSESYIPNAANWIISIGFLNKEIEKADIHIADTGENPEAPHPRELIDLEVGMAGVIMDTLRSEIT